MNKTEARIILEDLKEFLLVEKKYDRRIQVFAATSGITSDFPPDRIILNIGSVSHAIDETMTIYCYFNSNIANISDPNYREKFYEYLVNEAGLSPLHLLDIN